MIYDFRILPYALGDIVIYLIQTACLNSYKTKTKAIYWRCDLKKFHPIQPNISPKNCLQMIGDLNEALNFNPLLLPVKKANHEDDTFGCETEIDRIINKFYKNYLSSGQVEQFHNYFNTEIASHAPINKYFSIHKKIPLLKLPKNIEQATTSKIFLNTKKKKWIVMHLRFRGIDGKWNLADMERNADPSFWFQVISKIAFSLKKKYAILLLGPASGYPESFLKIPGVFSLNNMGGTLKDSIAALLTAEAFLGSSSGFANCATFANIPYLIFDVTENGYKNYQIPINSHKLPFAQKNQYLSPVCASENEIYSKIRRVLPALKCLKKITRQQLSYRQMRADIAKNKAFQKPIEKILKEAGTKKNHDLMQKIILLEAAAPSLKTNWILQLIKEKTLDGIWLTDPLLTLLVQKIENQEILRIKNTIQKNLQASKIYLPRIEKELENLWPSAHKDLNIRASANLVGFFRKLGFESISKPLFKTLYIFWLIWYRIFYRPLARHRF